MKNIHIGDGDAENGVEKPRPKWGGGEYCARCGRQVYIAERKQGAGNVSVSIGIFGAPRKIKKNYCALLSGKDWPWFGILMKRVLQVYHDVCFTCAVCNKKLSATILAEREGEVFCKSKSYFLSMPDDATNVTYTGFDKIFIS